MAATVGSLSNGEQRDRQRREDSGSPQVTDHQRKREKNRSANYIKSKPANCISGILDSLDTLALAPSATANSSLSGGQSYSDSISELSQIESLDSTSRRSYHAVSFSGLAGHTAEGSVPSHMEDEEEPNNAALPPTVRTSRPPSGFSHYTAPRTPSFTGVDPLPLARTPSLRSRRSSYSSLTAGRERPSYAKNKLSAESWVKQNTINHGSSIESDRSGSRNRSRRTVERQTSQESLGHSRARITSTPNAYEAAEGPKTSRAEQIIAKINTPIASSPRGRLYLNDSDSTGESIGETAASPTPSGGGYFDIPQAETRDEDWLPTKSPLRKTMIVDSIPTRTSSLRQSHSKSPGRSKKKDRKSKVQAEKTESTPDRTAVDAHESNVVDELTSESKVDSVMGATARSIPESSWADLGEDDGTVKRIRELQEQRKSRHIELQRTTSPEMVTIAVPLTPAKVEAIPIQKFSKPSSEEQRSQRASRLRPLPSRVATEPPVKAHKVLGISADIPIPAAKVHLLNGVNGEPDHRRRRTLSVDGKASQVAPMFIDSSSPTPPLSLDYSYADAVDALQGAQREMKKDSRPKSMQQRKASTSISEQLPDITAQYPGTQLNLVPVVSPSPPKPSIQPSKSVRRKQQDRWTLYHPDLPLDFERRKSRRKSTSDARNARHMEDEEEPPVPRRNSIEDAVTEFLHHGRLSRRIKHPRTGRIISFSEVGDRNGAAVFVCVGMGLTRYITAFYDELATTLRLRLITVDRPGVGGSEPFSATDRSGPLNWPDDVVAICQYLDISKFSMVAHSAGAIYALATALVLPHMVHGKVHLLAPWIPPSQLEAVTHSRASAAPAGALPRSQRILRVLPTPFLRAANSSFMTATSASLKPATKRTKSGSYAITAPPPRTNARPATRDGAPANAIEINRRESLMLMDQYMPDLNQMENFPIPVKTESETGTSYGTQNSLLMTATAGPMDPSFEMASSALNAAEHKEKERKTEYTTHLTQRTWELAVRDSNPATDLLVCLERHGDVGFRYTDVSREVVMTHGSEDKRVPLANIKWLAGQMNRRAEAAPHSVPPSRDAWDTTNTRGGCELRVLQGEGHGLMASPTIMGNVLTEIAGYWRAR